MRQNESGNVFFYIFISIVLLAALSFAVSQGGRSSITQLTQDTRSLVASEIIGYADTVSKAVTQLRLRGTTLNELSFANEFLSAGEYGTYNNDPANEVFNPVGGAVIYSDPPGDATTTGSENWYFLADNEIENVGTTAGTAASADLIMAVLNVRQDVCTEINDLLGVGTAGAAPPTDNDIDSDTKFEPIALPASPMGYDETIGDEDAVLDGQREACYDQGGTQFIYYKVLQPR